MILHYWPDSALETPPPSKLGRGRFPDQKNVTISLIIDLMFLGVPFQVRP
jgi:hypothetical protein